MTDYSRLSMPIGEAMFSRRSVRTFKPDPIPKENLSLIVEAAVKAPNSGNRQVGCLFLVPDRAKIREFVRPALPRGVVGQAPRREGLAVLPRAPL
jgi:nitroreductase